MLERWEELRAKLQAGGFWRSSDRLKATRLLGRQPIDAVDDRRVAEIFMASHALRPVGKAFRELRSDMGAEAHVDFVADIKGWQTRSGTVKINLALGGLPVFASHPDFDPQVHGGTIVLAESLDDVENAYQEAVAGRPSTAPFADICIPSVFDDSLAPAGQHVMSLFTQWVPHTFADEPDDAAVDAYADRVIARLEAVAPGFTDSVLHRQVIGPHQMQAEYGLVGGNIFHGELSLGQMFHGRPAAGYADLRTPVGGLYQAGSATHGGGGVTGIPGRNVVRQVLADRRAARWRRRGGAVGAVAGGEGSEPR